MDNQKCFVSTNPLAIFNHTPLVRRFNRCFVMKVLLGAVYSIAHYTTPNTCLFDLKCSLLTFDCRCSSELLK